MDGLNERQLSVLKEMIASCSAICEPGLIAMLEGRGLVERMGERRARLTDRGALLARALIRSERGSGTVWDSSRGKAFVL